MASVKPAVKINTKLIYNNPIILSEKVKDRVVGHSEEIDILSLEITNYFLKLQNKHLFKKFKKNNIFITGTSGVGKTYVVESIADILDIPFIPIDITTYTSSGFQGESVKDIVKAIDKVLEENEDQSCIVFIDEVDKLKFGGTENTANKDISGTGVQEELLRLIESVDFIRGVDMSKVLFICAGAFEGIESIVRREHKMGFNSKYVNDSALRRNITRNHLIKFGLMPEFVGRFSSLLNFGSLDEEDLGKILKSKHGLLDEYKLLCSLHNIKATIPNDFIEVLIKNAMKENLGARSLNNSFIPYSNHVLYNALKSKKSKIKLSEESYLSFIEA